MWQMRTNPNGLLMLLCAFAVVSFYVALHSVLYFMHVATLTVAINSADHALVTVLILNNFSEIKSFVFKKFDAQNLFQLACSEVTERFNISLFLVSIMAVTMAQEGCSKEIVAPHMQIMGLLLVGEAIADWIKHAFINKFNNINSDVYSDFVRVLRSDILHCHRTNARLENTHSTTRRVGLAQIPLACVTLRYIRLGYSGAAMQRFLASNSVFSSVLIALLFWMTLVLVKVFLGVGLIVFAAKSHNNDFERGFFAKITATPEQKTKVTTLSTIDRYTVWKGRVV